jgi:hypothetical protein
VNARVLANRIPRARLTIVKRAGHLLLWDDAPNVAPHIRSFIDDRGTKKRSSAQAVKRSKTAYPRGSYTPMQTPAAS